MDLHVFRALAPQAAAVWRRTDRDGLSRAVERELLRRARDYYQLWRSAQNPPKDVWHMSTLRYKGRGLRHWLVDALLYYLDGPEAIGDPVAACGAGGGEKAGWRQDKPGPRLKITCPKCKKLLRQVAGAKVAAELLGETK